MVAPDLWLLVDDTDAAVSTPAGDRLCEDGAPLATPADPRLSLASSTEEELTLLFGEAGWPLIDSRRRPGPPLPDDACWLCSSRCASATMAWFWKSAEPEKISELAASMCGNSTAMGAPKFV